MWNGEGRWEADPGIIFEKLAISVPLNRTVAVENLSSPTPSGRIKEVFGWTLISSGYLSFPEIH
jgi:hypothetical protein